MKVKDVISYLNNEIAKTYDKENEYLQGLAINRAPDYEELRKAEAQTERRAALGRVLAWIERGGR